MGQFLQEVGLKWGLLHVTNTGPVPCFVVPNGIGVPSWKPLCFCEPIDKKFLPITT